MVKGGSFVPADPWVAVNATYVVQAVNSAARMTTRLGVELVTVPTYALFALLPGENASDARILWDAAHGRWVGVAVVFPNDFSSNSLAIAISDSSDPTGSWRVLFYGYGTDLPDYPSIASSSDKLGFRCDDPRAPPGRAR